MDDALQPRPHAERLISRGVTLALVGGCLAILVHTARAVLSLYTPLPWGDINTEHLWISAHGMSVPDLFRPHNEHVIVLPRLFFLVDFYVFGATSAFLQVISFLLAIAAVGVFWCVAARWFFTRRWDAGMYACLLAAGCVNGLQMVNLVCGLMLQHWLVNFLMLLFALLFALQSVPQDGRKDSWLAAAMLPLSCAAVFTSGSGIMCLATATFLGVMFGLGWRKVLYFAGLMAVLAVLYLYCNATAGESKFSVFLKTPYDAVKFYFAFLGGPGSRYHVWPADSQFWTFSGRWAVIRGMALFSLGAGLCLREWWQPSRRGVFSVFQVFVIVLVFATGLASVSTRLPLGIFEGTNSKYTCTVMLAWMAVFSLALKQLSPYVRLSPISRSVGWAAAFVVVLLWVVPGHFREIRVWRQWTNHLWESETALIAGVYDKTLVSTLDWRPEALFRVVQEDFRPRRWGPFARYNFEIGDALAERFRINADYPAVGEVIRLEPIETAGKTAGAKVSGWGWDERRRRPFWDILLTDPSGRIIGLAHTTRPNPEAAQRYADPARGQCGWFGMLRGDPPAKLSVYGVIEGTREVCPLVVRP